VARKASAKREDEGANRPLWRCPECGREFAKPRQWHSCLTQDLADHFHGKNPTVRTIFDRLLNELRAIGPVRVDAVKTSINLISKHHFGGVKVRRNYLRIGFLAEAPIRSSRIVHSEHLGPSRVAHSVEIHSVDEVDEELVAWLTRAYELQS
jgi:hypothetical protein